MKAIIVQLSWLTNVKKSDILLGDFNTNALSNETYVGVSNAFTEYKFMVSEPTYINVDLLDHLYLMKQFLFAKHVTSAVKNIYLSDNDAVKIHIQKRKWEESDRDMEFQYPSGGNSKIIKDF